MRDGYFFECITKKHFGHILPLGIYKPTTTDLDLEKGTDCIMYNINVDITLNYDNKMYVENIGSYDVCGAYKIKLGIRRRNLCHEFKHPVLVMGFELCVEPSEARLLVQLLDKQDIIIMLNQYLDALHPENTGITVESLLG